MNKQLEQSMQLALDRVVVCKMRLVAMMFACRKGNWERYRTDSNDREYDALFLQLHRQILDAYRYLFMFGCVIPAEMLRKARESALELWGRERQEIMHLLDLNLDSPGSYRADIEDQFRKALKRELESDFNVEIKDGPKD